MGGGIGSRLELVGGEKLIDKRQVEVFVLPYLIAVDDEGRFVSFVDELSDSVTANLIGHPVDCVPKRIALFKDDERQPALVGCCCKLIN